MIVSTRELIPMVREALDRGQDVRLTATGSSMLPFIYDGDVLELISAATPRLGDIVLVRLATSGAQERYVLHRLVRLQDDGVFFIRGDAQSVSDGPYSPASLVARVTVVWHKGQARSMDAGPWRLTGLLWMCCAPVSLWLLNLALKIRRMYRRRQC